MLLDTTARKIEIFDPANKRHRTYYANFLRDRTWGHCPIRFAVNDSEASNNNLAYAMQRKLVEYYMAKEFHLASEQINDRL